MPAPAVIPAPRAYINAAAVKGFVVELRVDKPSMAQSLSPDRRPPHLQPVNNQKQKSRDRYSLSNYACNACQRRDARDITVTKKV